MTQAGRNTHGSFAQHDLSIHQGRRVSQARAARSARDIVPAAQIIADGSIHRCDAAGKNGKGDAVYLLHLDGTPAGGLENWRDGKGWESWRFDIGHALTPAERDALRKKAEAASDRRSSRVRVPSWSSPKGDIMKI